ncbi:SLC13 family permease [Trichloromonas sp.]|uniref:SLC13 family permease n=1 Tax=Trichloromonas sp. TaxID=3069249 RepID=UPI002A3BD38F|nr:anion permease [Trichloromonas sp.]
MSSLEAAETLLSLPLFRDCSRQSLARLLPHVAARHLASSEVLHAFDAEAETTFLILDGEFELDLGGGRKARIGGGFLGEEAGIGLDRYQATATALGPARVLAIPGDLLHKLADETRSVLPALLESLAERGQERRSRDRAATAGGTAKKQEGARILCGWLLATAVPFAVFFLLREAPDIAGVQTAYLLAVVSSAVVMWVFRLLPDFVPALFAVLGIVLLNLAPPEVALAGFSSDTFFMALSIFALSVVTTTSGFSYRVLLWLLRLGPPNKIWYNLSLFIAGVILTPIVPTANGRVAIVAPFFNDLAGTLGKDSCANEKQRLAVSALSGVSLLSAIFMSAKSINFVIFGFLPVQDQAHFQWVHWFYAASVCGLALTLLYLLLAWLLFRNPSRPTMSRELIADQLRILGRMKSAEWASLLGLLLMLAAVLTVSVHGVEVPWITFAIMYVLLMLMPPQKEKIRQIV